MAQPIRSLDTLRVASPCPESWATMSGDDRVRFCSRCQLNVYNLSVMSLAEAEGLILKKEGRLCVRYYRRDDGTILTRDCPVGWRAARRKVLLIAGSAVFLFAIPVLAFLDVKRGNGGQGNSLASTGTRMIRGKGILRNSRLRRIQPFATVLEWIDPAPPPPRWTTGVRFIAPRPPPSRTSGTGGESEEK
jgi:hypothetical protein